MPITFPAHQAAVLPLKLWRPRWFDGTALVVGSGSPDLFSVLSSPDGFSSHGTEGVAVAVVFTILYATVLRRWAVDGLFGSLPDFGPFQARSYRVLALGRPRLLVTAFSAFVGVFSHVFIDSFTHPGRSGATLLGLNRVLIDTEVFTASGARILQYFGHTVGSLVGVMLFVLVVSKRHLGEWYGTDTITAARNAPVRPRARLRTTLVVAASVAAGFAWGVGHEVFPVFHMGLAFVLGLLLAGILNGTKPTARVERCRATSTRPATTSSMSSRDL